MRSYAQEIFDEPFDEDSIITEDRLTPAEFLETATEEIHTQIGAEAAEQLSPNQFSNWQSFLQAQYALWFDDHVQDPTDHDWTVELGGKLKTHAFFRNLIRVLGNEAKSLEEIAAGLRKVDPALESVEPAFLARLVESLLSLVSAARRTEETGRLLPFLDVRV